MIAIILIFTVLILIYYLAIKPFFYWSSKNVRTGKIIPLFGDNLNIFLGKESFTEMTMRLYNTFPDGRYMGAYQFLLPTLVLKSPELIKQICVKDSDYFLDHRSIVPDGVDELWSKNLFSLKGKTWKSMRSTLSPSFTSSKMRSMFVLICQNAKSFTDYYLKKNEEVVEIEFKDAFGRYTTDVIASSAFGVQVDSLTDRENDFYIMSKDAAGFSSLYTRIVFLLYQLAPKLVAISGLPLVKKNVKKFFIETVQNTIRSRDERNIKRPDMLGTLMNLRKGQSIENEDDVGFSVVDEHQEMKKKLNGDLTDIDIASQVFVFLLGGFDTTSNALCFLAYELAVNPDIQKRLIEEVDENRSENVDLSFETIMKMPYMDMVVNESMRKWPVAVAADRIVTKPYTIQPESPDEQPVDLQLNDNIFIPIIGIHRDPKYYPDPMKFDPERFSPDNKKSIDPYTYLPFGVGPRNCIGSRFALLEMKAVLFYILTSFEIIPVSKTEIPIKISKTSLNMLPDNGFPLGLKRRH